MNDFLDLLGASGTHYRYTAAEGQLSPAGGNFAIVRLLNDGSWELLRLGETDSLAAVAVVERGRALAEHGTAIRLYARLNISSSVRDNELGDLLAAYGPVLRAAEPV